MGLEVRNYAEKELLELRSSRVFIDKRIGEVSFESGEGAVGVLTYFVNQLRAGDKKTPYSMVTAMSRSADKNSLIPMDMADDDFLWLCFYNCGKTNSTQSRSSSGNTGSQQQQPVAASGSR